MSKTFMPPLADRHRDIDRDCWMRFEVEGANAARAFARAEGMIEHRAQLIWDGVALNSTPSIGLYKESEVALCTAGIGLDWGGWGYDMLTETQLATNRRSIPSVGDEEQFTRAVCRIVESRPATTYDNFRRALRAGYQRPSTVDFLLNSPFKE